MFSVLIFPASSGTSIPQPERSAVHQWVMVVMIVGQSSHAVFSTKIYRMTDHHFRSKDTKSICRYTCREILHL